jgi:hypothetical protein
MNIYSEYGAVLTGVSDILYPLEKKVMDIFIEAFPDVTVTEFRILFREFQFGLDSRVAEEVLIRAMKQKKANRDAQRVRVVKLEKAEVEMEPLVDPASDQGMYMRQDNISAGLPEDSGLKEE